MFISLSSMDGEGSVFWGSTYTEVGGVQSYGYGRCFVEGVRNRYIFWIRVDTEQQYLEVDCDSGAPMGDWTSSL